MTGMARQADVLDEGVLAEIVTRIVAAVQPLRIIVFGSAARGEMTADSDVDLLVVMPEGAHRLQTAQDLHTRLFGIPVPVDIVVATPSDLARHADNPGLIYREALRGGRAVYAA
jgi:predicted nucleotidyltransferase